MNTNPGVRVSGMTTRRRHARRQVGPYRATPKAVRFFIAIATFPRETERRHAQLPSNICRFPALPRWVPP